MYYYLPGSLKRRLILELKDSFSAHPVYRKITPFIQNKFAFDERPQMGIVVKGASANKVQLSADNFLGIVQSKVMLAYVGQPVFPLEWVREDLAIAAGSFTDPGVYFMEILSAPESPGQEGFFAIDPLLTVRDEALLLFQTGIESEAQLQNIPAKGTVRLWQNAQYLLLEGQDYTVNYETGAITFIGHYGPSARVIADYRYPAPSIGPVPFMWNSADSTTLPGVVLAFGKRAEKGQKIAVVVYPERVDAAQAYGGKFETSFDLDVITRDSTQMEEVAELVMMYLWTQKKARLEFEGIEIVDISMGGESEEPADETGDEYFYTASLSIQLRADWEVHVPLPLTISRVTTETPQSEVDPSASTGLKTVVSPMFFATHPILANRNPDYERIG